MCLKLWDLTEICFYSPWTVRSSNGQSVIKWRGIVHTEPLLYSPTAKYSFPKYSSSPQAPCLCWSPHSLLPALLSHSSHNLRVSHSDPLASTLLPPLSLSLLHARTHTRGLSFTVNQKSTYANWVCAYVQELKHHSPSPTALAAFCSDTFQSRVHFVAQRSTVWCSTPVQDGTMKEEVYPHTGWAQLFPFRNKCNVTQIPARMSNSFLGLRLPTAWGAQGF